MRNCHYSVVDVASGGVVDSNNHVERGGVGLASNWAVKVSAVSLETPLPTSLGLNTSNLLGSITDHLTSHIEVVL